MNGIINIYKEKGFTSHDVVNIVRKALGNIKTGHTGTLDPDAEGVLPICIGKATKISDYIASDIKGYRAELILGAETDTQDSTGTVINTFDLDFDEKKISTVINSFIGSYMQTPPMYSAIKVNGQKLYKLARQGIEIERTQRKVEIYSIHILEFQPPNKVVFETVCSKGTYIRTLCSDIGAKLNLGGHMGKLIRLRSGKFYLADAVKIDDFLKLVSRGVIENVVTPIESVLSDYKKVYVTENAGKLLYNGNKIPIDCVQNADNVQKNEKILVNDWLGKLVGIYLYDKDYLKPIVILF